VRHVLGCVLRDRPAQGGRGGPGLHPARASTLASSSDLLLWSTQHPTDWRKVWQLVEDKWNRNDPCPDGALLPFNIDAKLNGAYIAFGLLFGGGDFEATMEISTRCGQDSDCNPSSAAGVLGVMLGYDAHPRQVHRGHPRPRKPEVLIHRLFLQRHRPSTEVRALKIIEQTGGRVTDHAVVIAPQKPKAPKLEQWSPGIPTHRLQTTDANWSFTGAWETDRGSKISRSAGNEATLRFDGVAVAILGHLHQDGGRAEVFLDGKRAGLADAYIVERTHDNVLWHVYGLKPGDHTVRFVTLQDRDSRSSGTRVTLQGAVVYGKP
jgi:hypothetical protein